MSSKIALTGATGFFGAALMNRFLESGYEINALARDPQKLQPWREEIDRGQVRLVKGDLNNLSALRALAEDVDHFIHCAGVTHPREDQDYHEINVDGAANAAIAFKARAKPSGRFIHISSLSAREPHLSPYAKSKRTSEDVVEAEIAPLLFITLRMPALYGPGDTATLPYFKLIKQGLAPEPAARAEPRASILHVFDAANAVLSAASANLSSGIYEVGDHKAQGHSWQEIGATLGEALHASPKRLRVPKALLASYYAVLLRFERTMKKSPSVRTGQINEFFHEDWVARANLFSAATTWKPKISLKEGFAKTAQWYQKNNLL